MAQNGERTFAYAYKDMAYNEFMVDFEDSNGFHTEESRKRLEADLNLICSFGLRDDLQEGTQDAIQMARDGGITVRMCSGDNMFTAKKTAVEATIISEEEMNDNDVCMAGSVFFQRIGGLQKSINKEGIEKFSVGDKASFKQIAPKLRVLARCEPDHKLALVVGLRDQNETVAMTGDSLNDARALEFADVGFAMHSGCEVTKDNADIIIMNNSFSATIDAVRFGRNVYDNIRKFLQFQMTVNIVIILSVFLFGMVTGFSPMSIIQLLWINLVMDTLAALSLATEPPSDEKIKGRPIKPTHPIMGHVMWRTILGMAIWQFVVMIVMMFATPAMFGLSMSLFEPPTTPNDDHYVFNSIVFNTFLFMTIINQINCRKLGARDFNVFNTLFNNFYFILIFVATIAAQVCMTQFGGALFQLAPLSIVQWIIIVCIGLSTLGVAAGLKAVPEEKSEKIPVHINENAPKEDMMGKYLNQNHDDSFRLGDESF